MLIFSLFSFFLTVSVGETISKLFTCQPETGSSLLDFLVGKILKPRMDSVGRRMQFSSRHPC